MMRVRFSLRLAQALVVSLPLLVAACSSDNKQQNPTPEPDDNDGGAPALPPSYPPALSPQDCVGTIDKLSLTQPQGAAVWGGLVVLEFTAAGGKLDSFDVQAYDPALGAWTNYYVAVQAQGQRDDGSYFLAVSPYYSDATKDQQLKLRVRPSQQGCPDATWTESEPFGAGDPLVGTSWHSDISAGSLQGQLSLLRNSLPGNMALPGAELKVGDATIDVKFGKKGIFTETVSIPITTEKSLAWNGCSLGLTFSGTYSLKLRQQYGGIALTVTDQQLTSFDATACDLPTLKEMDFTALDPLPELGALSQQVSINYLPTLYKEPGPPVWQNNAFGGIFQQLPQFLSYQTKTETGSVSGNLFAQELTLTQE